MNPPVADSIFNHAAKAIELQRSVPDEKGSVLAIGRIPGHYRGEMLTPVIGELRDLLTYAIELRRQVLDPNDFASVVLLDWAQRAGDHLRCRVRQGS